MITPGVLHLAALLLRTDSSLPAIGVPETVATTVNYATTRESHELRMKVGQRLSQILAQTMTLIGILRHQRHYVDIHIARSEHQNLQGSVLAVGTWSQHSLILAPSLVAYVDCSLSQQFGILWRPTRLRLNQHNAHILGIATNIAHKNGEVVLLAGLYRNAVETIVLDTEARPASIVVVLLGALSVQSHIGGVVGMYRIVHTWLNPSCRVTWANHLPGCARSPTVALNRRELERAVL